MKKRLVSVKEYEEFQKFRSRSFEETQLQHSITCFDRHIPGHHVRLHENVCALISDLGGSLTHYQDAGDGADMNALSAYDKGRVGICTLEEEYTIGRGVFSDLDEALNPKAEKVFMYGNHEERYLRWLRDSDNAKIGETNVTSPEEGFGLDESWLIIRNYPDGEYYLPTGLEIIHGVFFNKYAAGKHAEEHAESVAHGHTHRYQVVSPNHKTTGYSCPCMADVDSPICAYMKKTQREKWKNGFLLTSWIKDNPSKNWVQPIIAQRDGSFYAAGKLYA